MCCLHQSDLWCAGLAGQRDDSGRTLRDWEQIIGIGAPGTLYSPEFYCMGMVINRAVMAARNTTQDKKVAIIFDNSEEKRAINEYIFSMYQKAHNKVLFGAEIMGISFFSSDKFVPLQGADMIAWETYNHARRFFRAGSRVSPRPHLAAMVNVGRLLTYMLGAREVEIAKGYLDQIKAGVDFSKIYPFPLD